MNSISTARVALAATLVVAGLFGPAKAFGQSAAPAGAGQTVEVREGDVWSPATVVSREGRRVQIKYEDGTVEWVTTDRVRETGAANTGKSDATPAAGGAPAAPGAKPAAAAPAKKKWADHLFPSGTAVEVKWGGSWWKAKVANRRGDWSLIAYDGESGHEWVEPWRIRKLGDKSYEIDHASPNSKMFSKIDPPPRETPGDGPDDDNAMGDVADRLAAMRKQTGARAPAGADGPAAPAAGSAEAATVTANVAEVRDVLISLAPWTYKAAPPPLAPGRVTETPISLSAVSKGASAERTIALDVSGGFAMLAYQSPFGSKSTTVDVVNLGMGQVSSRASFNGGPTVRSVAPDGKRMAAFGGGEKADGRVTIFDMPPSGTPKVVVAFDAYADTGEFFKDVTDVRLIDATHCYTLNTFNGRLIVWEIAPGSAKALWGSKLSSNAGVALSPDRKTIAVASDRTLALFDAVAGTPLGGCESAAGSLSSMSFRNDGKRLCGLSGPVLFQFDLESGKQLASIGLPVPLVTPSVAHLDGDTVALLNTAAGAGATLFDVSRRAVIGVYKFAGGATYSTAAGKLVAQSSNNDRRVFNAWTLPPKGTPPKPAVVLDAVTGADGAIKAALDVQVEADENGRKMVVDALTRQIAARGWTLVQGGAPTDVRVVVRTSTGKSEQRTYGSGPSFGPFAGPRETVNVTEKVVRLSVDVDGKPAWSIQSTTSASFMVSRKEGESIQQAVDASNGYNLGLVTSATLPETLMKPIEALPATVPTFTLANGGVRAN